MDTAADILIELLIYFKQLNLLEKLTAVLVIGGAVGGLCYWHLRLPAFRFDVVGSEAEGRRAALRGAWGCGLFKTKLCQGPGCPQLGCCDLRVRDRQGHDPSEQIREEKPGEHRRTSDDPAAANWRLLFLVLFRSPLCRRSGVLANAT